MVFSSNIFLFFFLPITLTVYYVCPKSVRNTVLLVFSLVFYAWGEPIYLLLMLFTIVLNYVSGYIIFKRQQNGKDAKTALVFSIILNLALLGYFKYFNFFIDSINVILPSSYKLIVHDVLLPVGISFYTFQAMSYTIDVYRREVQAQKNVISFGTYIALFPQLIAGPIVRYKDIACQLEDRKENVGQFFSGIVLFVIGLAKKMLLANKMGALWDITSVSGGTLSAWIGMLAYTMQIYFDFSGYSDMAIGLGRMFGFEFLKNFDYPYISQSITEFWRRWHISLSTWFREYVYIPLGGNRYGLKKQLVNLFVVWTLTGLWHGASWNFVFWGLYYFLWLTIEKLFLLKKIDRCPKTICRFYTFLVVAFGWVLFYFTDTAQLFAFIQRMFSFNAESAHSLNVILAYIPLMMIAFIASTPIAKHFYLRLKGKLLQDSVLFLWLAIIFLLSIAALASQSYNPFIYFRF